MKQFTALVKARTMEFVRDRGTFFWNLIFPFVLVIGFSFAFSGNNDELFKVGLIGEIPAGLESEFFSLDQIDFIDYSEEGTEVREELVEKVRQHQLDMLVDFSTGKFFLNQQSPNADVLRVLLLQRSIGESEFTALTGLSEQEVTGEDIRYVDWLVPGVIGMNMLFSCLFGVGFVIVRYRKNGVLKRIKATPVTPLMFISAQMASRFIIVIITSVVVFAGTNLFLGFTMKGSYFNLLLITALAILCMISLGLIFAARIKSEELASGLMNLVTFPMLIFSGVFFSLEGMPKIMQTFSKIFPLTHFVEGARDIMLEGAGLAAILPNVLSLAGMTILFLGIASLIFNWD